LAKVREGLSKWFRRRGIVFAAAWAREKPGGDVEHCHMLFHLPVDKPPYPDGKYLIKGGGPKVWKQFRLRKEHRRSRGIIHGKRCGTTQNIGRVARRRTLVTGNTMEKQRGGA
jgi:hypothetical protein